MARNATSYKPGHNNNPGIPRRRLSEKLLYITIKDYGNELIGILLDLARSSEDEMVKLQAADRLLKHLLVLAATGDAGDEDRKTSIALLDFVKEMQGKIPSEILDLMIGALKTLEEKAASQTLLDESANESTEDTDLEDKQDE